MRPAPVRPILCTVIAATIGLALPALPARAAAGAAISDSLYTAQHPRLLFSRAELPARRARVRDGGRDDDAYRFIHSLVDSLYPASSLGELMGQTFGMHFMLGTGLVCHLDDPPDTDARALGRSLAIAVADSFAADDNTFYSPVRLRILCWGYDMCMDTATPAERAYVRGEIESYVDSLMFAFNYERWLHPPYTSNLTAMIGSSLGLAAICLADEMDPARMSAALARADTFVAVWKRHMLDPAGAGREGVQYAAWSTHHLAAYFFARKRYDGFDYASDPAIRGIEQWFAHELLPEAGGVVNNLNDTSYLNYPLSRHNSYVDWAMTAWSSGLAAWLWERILGDYGYDWGLNVDHAATVLWWRPIAPAPPAASVPYAMLWRERGLYYYRTGWPDAGASDDVVFSFYSGAFHGGHTQQDQNAFTLYAFGNRFAADNGFDATNWRSEAHNMVFIDGAGQHYAGTSFGTDGNLAEHILGGYADFLLGDATAAYTTHSAYNNPGVPFPDDDWSFGYRGANPVAYAHRRWIVVHEGDTPPCFILQDDIEKDGAMHTYDWRMHTELTHTVDATGSSLRLTAGNGALLDMDILAASGSSPSFRSEVFANPSSDPDTRVLVLSSSAVTGRFAMVLRPAASAQDAPAVTRVAQGWGGAVVLAWPSGPADVVISNAGRDTATVDGPARVTTDARMAQVRFQRGMVSRAVLVDATTCDAGSVPLLRSTNGPMSLVIDARSVHVDSEDAAFTVYAPLATAVRVDGAAVPFMRAGEFVTRGPGTPSRTPPALGVSAYPQPFSAGVTVAIDSPVSVSAQAVVYDVRGRRVRQLWTGMLATGRTLVPWDGRDDRGVAVPSGVYFLRATAGTAARATRVVRVR